MKDKIECKQCGRKFTPYPYEERKFCSVKCYSKWTKENKGKDHPNWKDKITKKCKQCGKEFKVIPSKKDRKFCSRECYHKNEKKWNKEKIIKRLKELDKELYELTMSNVRDKVGNGIVNACYKYFESWNEAKREAGLEVNEEAWNKGKTKENSEKVRKWSEKLSKVKKEMDNSKLKNLFKEGYDERRVDTQFEEGHKSYLDEEAISKAIKALQKKPTDLEKKFIDFFDKHSLCFRYIGDGQLIIGGKCPDFVEGNGKKIVLEVSNKRFRKYFRGKEPSKYETERKQHFEKYGWKCLVFWEEDLEEPEEIIERVNNFV